MQLEFSLNNLEKYSNNKFHENPSTLQRSCSMRAGRQTDRHDEFNSRFSKFAKNNKIKNITA